VDIGANYSTLDRNKMADEESHPLRHFEQLQLNKSADYPHTDMSKQSYAQLPNARPPKIANLPFSGNRDNVDKNANKFHV